MKTRQYTWVALVNFLPPLLGYNIYLQIWGYQKNRNDREREKEIERESARERERKKIIQRDGKIVKMGKQKQCRRYATFKIRKYNIYLYSFRDQRSVHSIARGFAIRSFQNCYSIWLKISIWPQIKYKVEKRSVNVIVTSMIFSLFFHKTNIFFHHHLYFEFQI